MIFKKLFPNGLFKELPDFHSTERKRHLSGQVPELSNVEDTSYRPGYVWYCGISYPLNQFIKHHLMVGTTGSGKTNLLNITLSHLAMNIASGSGDMKMVLFDIKGNYHEELNARNVPYQTFDINNVDSANWDIAKDFQSYLKLDELGYNLIPVPENGDRFWTDAARAIFVGVLYSLFYLYGSDWTLADAVNMAGESYDNLVYFLERCPYNKPLIEKLLKTESEKAQASIQMVLYSSLRPLIPAAAHSQQAKTSFSLEEFFKGILLIQIDQSIKETSLPIVKALFKRLVELVLAQRDSATRRTFIVIDELQDSGKLDKLYEFLEMGRSKGGNLVAATLSVEGLYNHYGEIAANQIISLCNTKTCLLTQEQKTISLFVKLFGKVDIPKLSITNVTSFNENKENNGSSINESFDLSTKDLLTETEIGELLTASPETGIMGFCITPHKEYPKYRFTIPPEQIEKSKPQGIKHTEIIRKSPSEQVLKPWTPESRRKFFEPVKINREKTSVGTKQEQKLQAQKAINDLDTSMFDSEIEDSIREKVFSDLRELTAPHIDEYIEFFRSRHS